MEPPSSYREAYNRVRWPAETGLPKIDSLEVALTQPHAMVNDAGEVFYPAGPEDAEYFAVHHGARPLQASEGSDADPPER